MKTTARTTKLQAQTNTQSALCSLKAPWSSAPSLSLRLLSFRCKNCLSGCGFIISCLCINDKKSPQTEKERKKKERIFENWRFLKIVWTLKRTILHMSTAEWIYRFEFAKSHRTCSPDTTQEMSNDPVWMLRPSSLFFIHYSSFLQDPWRRSADDCSFSLLFSEANQLNWSSISAGAFWLPCWALTPELSVSSALHYGRGPGT